MLQAPRQKQPQISPIFISDKRRHPDRAQRRHRARRWRWHHRQAGPQRQRLRRCQLFDFGQRRVAHHPQGQCRGARDVVRLGGSRSQSPARLPFSYSITARSEVERIALKIGASAGRALSHRQSLRGLSLIQRISSNLNGLYLRHVLSNGKSSRPHIALLGMIDQLALVIEKMSSHVLWSGDSVRRQAFVTNRTV